MFISTDQLDPEQLAAGRLPGVQGASTSRDIAKVYPRRYLVETNYQGTPIQERGFQQGLRGIRRALDAGKDAAGNATDLQIAPRILRAGRVGPLQDLGYPTIADVAVNSPDDLVNATVEHYRRRLAELKANPPADDFRFSPSRLQSLEQKFNALDRDALRQQYEAEGRRLMANYSYDNEALLDDGLRLGPDTVIYDQGKPYKLSEFLEAQRKAR